jgi:hypothetical protein
MDAYLNGLRFDDIERRLRAASPGPWRWVDLGGGEVLIAVVTTGQLVVVESCASDGDLEFITHAREDIEFLLSRIEEDSWREHDIAE